MNDRINKTFICSIVFLDMIDYSKKSDAEQIEAKNQFNNLVSYALKDIAQNDRIIVDAGDGAAIACSGSPEDALFIALAIRDEIIKNNVGNKKPLFVRFGINLGTVRVMNDINSQVNIIGDGINVAQRIMSFAEPNQILVSRSYFEITSRLSQEIAQLFDYSGIKQDKHVREHEVYSVRLQKDVLLSNGRSAVPTSAEQATGTSAKTFNWAYAALAIPVMAVFLGLIKLNAAPKSPAITLVNAVEQTKPMEVLTPLASPKLKPSVNLSASVSSKVDSLMPNETMEKTRDTGTVQLVKDQTAEQDKSQAKFQAKLKPAKKKASKEAPADMPPEFVLPKKVPTDNSHPATAVNKPVTNSATNTADKSKDAKSKDKSTWQGFKDSVANGSEKQCTQAQIAMGQCH
ncbi:MAG: adenylate/guanylate cyclase domain-containing protein [Bdellovibrio sp.]|nr:adenylate/guanylate cyclase domain-containing protein [Methylotenera sp.]